MNVTLRSKIHDYVCCLLNILILNESKFLKYWLKVLVHKYLLTEKNFLVQKQTVKAVLPTFIERKLQLLYMVSATEWCSSDCLPSNYTVVILNLQALVKRVKLHNEIKLNLENLKQNKFNCIKKYH